MIEKVRRYLREQRLVSPGDRVAVAVSGGADSVALLLCLLELRQELGLVLSVAHFNHGIRGAEADQDQAFVEALAAKFDLPFHCGSGHAPAHARERKLSLETAARDLRQSWFQELRKTGTVDKIATAHSQNDQAETVMMRVIRGAGTRGLAGIAPWQKEKGLIRPLLEVTRREIEEYLEGIRQPWREDLTNRDLHHLRNRLRHELLPLLQREYNPSIRQTLTDLAQVARGEEEYWEEQTGKLFSRLIRSGHPSRSGRSNRPGEEVLALELAALRGLPVALRRRLLRALGEHFGVNLEFKHIEELLLFAGQTKPGKELDLPGNLVAKTLFRELQISRRQEAGPGGYSYALSIPGQVDIPELNRSIRAQLVTPGFGAQDSGYNSALLLDRTLLAPELTIRNWHAGDKYFPAHTRSPRKVKELLQAGRLGQEVSASERKLWPVVESGGELVWMRGFPAPAAFAVRSGAGVLIEELKMGPDGKTEQG